MNNLADHRTESRIHVETISIKMYKTFSHCQARGPSADISRCMSYLAS